MQNFEDYYQLLGIKPDATSEEIKRAYLDKSYILHPDRTLGAPQSARNKAEAELKKVNVAYDTLKDSLRRREYDTKYRPLKAKAKPLVAPQILKFKDVKPREVRRATFDIRNLGGPYGKINISNPNNWVKVVKWTSLTSTDELPLRVEIDVEPEEWGKSYLEHIFIRLDDEETRVTVQLQSAPQPAFETISPSSNPTNYTMTAPQNVRRATKKSLFSWIKLLLGIMILVSAAGIFYTGILAFTHQLPPIVGAVSFISVVVIFIVLTKITLSENFKWRKPGLGIIFLSVIGIYLVLTFSGVQPLADYKDSVFNEILSIYKSMLGS